MVNYPTVVPQMKFRFVFVSAGWACGGKELGSKQWRSSVFPACGEYLFWGRALLFFRPAEVNFSQVVHASGGHFFQEKGSRDKFDGRTYVELMRAMISSTVELMGTSVSST